MIWQQEAHLVIIACVCYRNEPAGRGSLPPPQFVINRAEVETVLKNPVHNSDFC